MTSAPLPDPTRRIDVIAGARPNFMKIAPILRAIAARRAAGGGRRAAGCRRGWCIPAYSTS
jgi:hypothetical protein